MADEVKKEIQLGIAHVLFIDIVGYSKLSINEQNAAVDELTQIVRATEQFQQAEAADRLIKIATGDGMALVFYTSPEAPVRCAIELSRALKDHPRLRLRMGIHSGPVSGVVDVTGQANLTGAGLNLAHRTMECGDAGHILLSKHVAEDLEEYEEWRPRLHDLGTCEVKHGVRIGIANLHDSEVGNPQLPKKLQAVKKHRTRVRWTEAAIALLVLAAVIAAFVFLLRRPTRSALTIPEKSVAVLPFENLSADPENAFFADGVQDEILNDLAKIADLKVISRTSVMQYKSGVKRNLRQIANELGVAHVVEGSVQRAANRVRVTAQLIDARTDTHLWVERYNRPLDDVFAIQSDIAKAIATQLQAKLSPKTRSAIEERPTKDLVAYDLYVRAKLLVMNPLIAGERWSEAARLLDQAIARDPDFFLAYCLIAETHSRLYWNFDHTPVRRDLADRAVKAALHLRPEAGEAHLARAQYLFNCNLDYDNARAELALARRTLPNDAQVFMSMGNIDRLQGRWNESARSFEEALELDPGNLFILRRLALNYLFMRRFAEEAAILDRALALDPKDSGSLVLRASVDLDLRADPKPLHEICEAFMNENPAGTAEWGQSWIELALCERDRALAERALATMPGGYVMNGLHIPRTLMEGCAGRAFGDDAAARKAFIAARAEVERTVRDQPDYGPPLCVLGLIDAGLGRKEEAIREGRRANELLPVTKDALGGAHIMEYLGVIYAWTGEKDLAIKQLAATLQVPSLLSYGRLRLHPFWDHLRGDPP